MKFFTSLGISLSLLISVHCYGVHATVIRYNTHCLECEHRGNPDPVDNIIFSHKPLVPYEHVLATPSQYVSAKKEIVEIWRAWVLQAIAERLSVLYSNDTSTENAIDSELLQKTCARLQSQMDYLTAVEYHALKTEGFIAVPEQDIVFLMQWAQRIDLSGDELVPVITVVLDDATTLVADDSCGDVAQVIYDHMYWQKLIEAGWVAVSPDGLGRVQPVLHTNVIGEKFHFYKTRFGIYFRETLGVDEKAPGDLVRIVKYLQKDPRHHQYVHGTKAIIWLKFPSDEAFNATLDGQYIPYSNNAQTATWAYIHDLQALYAELQS